MIKSIYGKNTIDTVNGKKTEAFPLGQGYPIMSLLFIIVLELLLAWQLGTNWNKNSPDWWERSESMSICRYHNIVYKIV